MARGPSPPDVRWCQLPVVADLVDRAPLGALSDTVDVDEHQYVATGTVWRAAQVASASGGRSRHPPEPSGHRGAAAEGASIVTPPASTGCRLAQVALAAIGEPADAFADARPDGRAVVYAHPADPPVWAACPPTRRRPAMLARAVMNGGRPTRRRGGRCSRPCSARRPAGCGRGRAETDVERSEAILDASRPRTAASRPAASSAARSSRPSPSAGTGATVSVRRSGGSCSTAARRRSTVRRHRRARVRAEASTVRRPRDQGGRCTS